MLGLAISVLCVLYFIVRGTGVGPGYICVKCVLYLIVRGTGVGPGYICVMCSLPYCEGNWCWAWLYLCYVFSTLL